MSVRPGIEEGAACTRVGAEGSRLLHVLKLGELHVAQKSATTQAPVEAITEDKFPKHLWYPLFTIPGEDAKKARFQVDSEGFADLVARTNVMVAWDTADLPLDTVDNALIAGHYERVLKEKTSSAEINQFRHEHLWLSNMFPALVSMTHPQAAMAYRAIPNEIRSALQYFPSVEHAFHAMKVDFSVAKTPEETKEALELYEGIRTAPTAKEAKALGRKIDSKYFNKSWDAKSRPLGEKVMRAAVESKFANSALYGLLLKSTKGKHLIEGNTFGDTKWGVIGVPGTYRGEFEDKRGNVVVVGNNKFGALLEEVRDTIGG